MNALTLVHNVISSKVKKGDFCIDATAGRGFDTAFCAKLWERGQSNCFRYSTKRDRQHKSVA